MARRRRAASVGVRLIRVARRLLPLVVAAAAGDRRALVGPVPALAAVGIGAAVRRVDGRQVLAHVVLKGHVAHRVARASRSRRRLVAPRGLVQPRVGKGRVADAAHARAAHAVAHRALAAAHVARVDSRALGDGHDGRRRRLGEAGRHRRHLPKRRAGLLRRHGRVAVALVAAAAAAAARAAVALAAVATALAVGVRRVAAVAAVAAAVAAVRALGAVAGDAAPDGRLVRRRNRLGARHGVERLLGRVADFAVHLVAAERVGRTRELEAFLDRPELAAQVSSKGGRARPRNVLD
mmetsp:Transcript_31404/g.108591  ORF Transcript_31404/g.108591 Transcript_31404/m.108591 type:complete len:294 (+) Transcript_31404:763-1644(+)